MQESRIKDENFYQVQGWMKNKLNLKGTKRDVYAIIYGFSQDGESEFTGSISYLKEWLDVSKPTIIKALQELTEDGIIIKRVETINNVSFNRYKANLLVVKNFNWGGKEILLVDSKEILPNNKDNIINNKKKVFIPPTLDEVRSYAIERKSLVDPVRFFEYFNAGGWVDAKGNKVKNWKQKFITWESHSVLNNDVKQYKPNFNSRKYEKGQLDKLFPSIDELEVV